MRLVVAMEFVAVYVGYSLGFDLRYIFTKIFTSLIFTYGGASVIMFDLLIVL